MGVVGSLGVHEPGYAHFGVEAAVRIGHLRDLLQYLGVQLDSQAHTACGVRVAKGRASTSPGSRMPAPLD